MRKRRTVEQQRCYVRMTLNQRIQHIVLMLSFFTLVITGLPLTFPDAPGSSAVVRLLGGFTTRSLIHRGAAVVLILLSIYHVFYMLLSKRGRMELKALTPRLDDLLDAVDMIKFYLGFSRRIPLFDRYNFIEKFEYLALAWGSVIMIASGFVLWWEEGAMRILPKWALDVARVVHSYEAILAFLAIIIWHFYHVHLNPEVFPMSRVWLDGRISEHELRELHPLEYKRVAEAGSILGAEETVCEVPPGGGEESAE